MSFQEIDAFIAIEQIRDAIERSCPAEGSRLADALANCGHVRDELRTLLGMVNVLADDLAKYTGRNVPHEEKRARHIVEQAFNQTAFAKAQP